VATLLTTLAQLVIRGERTNAWCFGKALAARIRGDLSQAMALIKLGC
jgi:hypothetical protein